MTLKTCSKCHHEFEISHFRYLHQRGRYMAECKQCERERQRKSGTSRDRAIKTIIRLCQVHGTSVVSEALSHLNPTHNEE